MPLRKSWLSLLQRLALTAALGCTATQAVAGNKAALLVGVNNYSQKSGFHDLQYAAKDVADMRKTLLSMGYEDQDIHVLNGENGAAPTRENLQAAINTLETQSPTGHDGSIMIVFAGHGFNKDGNSYLCPADYDPENPASALPVSDLQHLLEQSTAAGRFLIIDACRNEHLSRADDEFNLRSSLARLQGSAAAAQGVMVLSSCMPNQTSHEIGQSRRPAQASITHAGHVPVPRNNGVFLHYVMQGMLGSADAASANHEDGFDGLITASELCEFVCFETRRFVQSEFDTNQTPWSDMHATGQLVMTRLTSEQKSQRPLVKVRTQQSLLDQQMAEHYTGDGVMLLVGGDAELRPLAAKRFTEAIDLSTDLYMPRRLRALLYVLEGNNDKNQAMEKYRSALADMQHVGSNLRLAVPFNAQPLTFSSASHGGYQTTSLQTINPGDVIEVNGLVQRNGKWSLKVCRVHRGMTENEGQIREDVDLHVDLALIATPEASKAQLQDLQRLRKPTADELRMINNTRHQAMNAPNVGIALKVSGDVAATAGAGEAGRIISDVGQGIDLLQRAKEEKRRNGRVSPNTGRQIFNFGLRFAP